ncbi:MAG: hypothetical protein IPK19_10420 [Chloroflexi bacterium]|nr:hypothetical protein [Chloroflexota bacterium]
MYQQAEAIINEHVPIISIDYESQTWLIQPYVENFIETTTSVGTIFRYAQPPGLKVNRWFVPQSTSEGGLTALHIPRRQPRSERGMILEGLRASSTAADDPHDARDISPSRSFSACDPGSPWDKFGASASPARHQNLDAKYGLDKPIVEQYFIFLWEYSHAVTSATRIPVPGGRSAAFSSNIFQCRFS